MFAKGCGLGVNDVMHVLSLQPLLPFREIYELGKKAFVSFVHFYYKHECKLIFQAKGEPL